MPQGNVHSDKPPRIPRSMPGKWTKETGINNAALTGETLDQFFDYDFINAPPIDQVAMMNGVAWGTCRPAE